MHAQRTNVMKCYFAYYIVTINILAGILFSLDKLLARAGRRRIPELLLHFLEALGGCFATTFLMTLIRHKNRKFSYYGWTYFLLALWIFGAGIIYFINITN